MATFILPSKAATPGAPDEPAFDDEEMRAIAARRAEADARCRRSALPVPPRKHQLLPIFRSSTATPDNIVVRVRQDDSEKSSVRELVVPTATTSIKIEVP